MNIYTITAVEIGPNPFSPTGGGLVNNPRIFGYLSSKELAYEAVEENQCEMHEAKFTHIIVEEVPHGILAQSSVKRWYEWNYADKKWQQCKWPTDVPENTTNFSMG